MTVRDLIEDLRRYPEHAPVVCLIDASIATEIRADVSGSIASMQCPILNCERAATSSGYGVAIVATFD